MAIDAGDGMVEVQMTGSAHLSGFTVSIGRTSTTFPTHDLEKGSVRRCRYSVAMAPVGSGGA